MEAFEPNASGRLDSWKEIAVYLQRQVRTVNLWEKTEGLPVHRHLHAKRGTVYAFKSELDRWRQQRALASTAAPALARRSPIMVAVLPFRNLSGDTSQDYFSNGLTEEMISQLGRVNPQFVGVIAHASSMHYKDSDAAPGAIGADLQVDYTLAGSVIVHGERVRITAQLSTVREQVSIWSQTYDREVADIFFLQTEVAGRIADSVEAKLQPESAPRSRRRAATTSQAAYEAYLKGRNYWNQRTEESLLKAAHYFQRAVTMDPRLAVAHCGLADAYNLLAVYGVLPPNEAMPLARVGAMRALEINRELGEAHACLADISCFYEWDWDTARQSYQRALALNPSYATAHHFYAYYLAAVGDHTRALAEIKLAQAYDPHSMIITVWKGILLRLAGKSETAIEVCMEATKTDPHYALAHWALGLAFETTGRMGPALREFEAAAALSGQSPGMLASLACHLGLRGDGQRAAGILQQLRTLSAQRYVPAYDLALVCLGLGREEEALGYLGKAWAEQSPWIVTAPREPRLQTLACRPRFQDLVRRLRLPAPKGPPNASYKPNA